jgi:hypothetical protein
MQCEVCGNDYAHAFTVVRNDEHFVFDCFECAIHALAPSCAHCGCKIVGHGVDRDDEIFCCDHCLRATDGEMDDAVDLEVDEAGDDATDEDDEDDDLDNVEFEDEDNADMTTPSRAGRARRR